LPDDDPEDDAPVMLRWALRGVGGSSGPPICVVESRPTLKRWPARVSVCEALLKAFVKPAPAGPREPVSLP
jgi:hypothetical protein